MPEAMAPPRRNKLSKKSRARLQQARMVQARAAAEQNAKWLRQFDVNRSGRLERDELAALLQHVHPEAGTPKAEALDLLIMRATELRTYTITMPGDPHGAVRGEMLTAVVSGYSLYLLANDALDRHSASGGVVALADLPGLMRDANEGLECEASDVDFVVNCMGSSINGIDSASHVSRDDLLEAMSAWRIDKIAETADADRESLEEDGDGVLHEGSDEGGDAPAAAESASGRPAARAGARQLARDDAESVATAPASVATARGGGNRTSSACVLL